MPDILAPDGNFYECLPETWGCIFFDAEEKEKIFQPFVKLYGQSARELLPAIMVK